MNTDPNLPRASELLTGNPNSEVTLIGIGAHQTSISPTRADTTPPAVREALLRFSTYCASHDQDLRELNIFDAGNVKSQDHAAGEQRVHEQLQGLKDKFLIAIGEIIRLPTRLQLDFGAVKYVMRD